MVSLKNIKMKPKLVTLFLLIGIIPSAIIGWFSAHQATESLMEETYNQLISMREIKKSEIEYPSILTMQ